MFKSHSTKFVSLALAVSMLTVLLAVCVSQQATAITPLVLIPEPDNPYPGCEWSLLMDGDQLDVWYPSWPNYETLYYTHADKSDLGSFVAPEIVLTGIRFPTVVENNGTYYLFTSKPPAGESGIYLYQSADKTTWTPMNGGDPVMALSGNPASQWHCIWNPGVVVIDGIFHIFVDCGTQLDGSAYVLAYSHSTIEAMAWDANRTETAIIPGGVNSCPIYVPERNSILLVYCQYTYYPIIEFHVTAAYASLDSDLYQPSSWTLSPTFNLYNGATNTADPCLVYCGNTAEHDIMISYMHMQTHVDLGYYDDVNLTAFFDTILYGAPVTITSIPVTVGHVNLTYSYQLTAIGSNITWSVVSDAGWLSIDPVTGMLNGTPTAIGMFNVNVTGTCGDYSDSQTYVLTVDNLGWIVGVTDLIWSVFPIFLLLMFLGIVTMALRRRD